MCRRIVTKLVLLPIFILSVVALVTYAGPPVHAASLNEQSGPPGSTISQGDWLLRAAEARRLFGLSGHGVRVGVISDGVEGLEVAQAAGELPGNCTDSLPGTPCVQVDRANKGRGSEGLAMLEVIYDLAPSAIAGFSSGSAGGPAGFIAAVDYLQNSFGAQVIVDDIGFMSGPFFEDGTVAVRVDAAVKAGPVFISAAGNDARRHYQAMFTTTGPCATGIQLDCRHLFTPTDDTLAITIPSGGTLLAVLQWSNPFSNTLATGSRLDDLNLYLLDSQGLPVAVADDQQARSLQPLEVLAYTNSSSTEQQLDLMIDGESLNTTGNLSIELFAGGPVTLEHITPVDSIFGHTALPSVLSVGAVSAAEPAFIEPYSSRGPVTIVYPNLEQRLKPDLVAVTCVATTAPGYAAFCGTSAAAAHTAALAVLLLEAQPELTQAQVRAALTAGAVDLGAPGFDTTFGAGRADLVRAIFAARGTPLTDAAYLPYVSR